MSVSLANFISTDKSVTNKRSNDCPNEVRIFLDEEIKRTLAHPGVDHPFLNAYSKQGLPKSESQFLYKETYYYFLHLPFYFIGIGSMTRDEKILKEIVHNVADELGSKISHSDLYLNFMNKIGVTKKEIEEHQPLETTVLLNQSIEKFFSKPTNIVTALGVLYAEETQSASAMEKYNDGLILEGWGQEIRYFWELHVGVEVSHCNAVFNCVYPYLSTEENRLLFSQGITDYMDLLANFWNSVAISLNQPSMIVELNG